MVWRNRTRQHGLSASLILCTLVLSLQLTTLTSAATPKSPQASSHSTISGPEAIARAKTWVAAKVPYNKYALNSDGYREDCVGLVSMAWGVSAPGMGNTTNVLKTYVTQISPDDLQPGDALVNDVGEGNPDNWRHIILFEGWVSSSNHKYYNGYEESPAFNGAHHSTNVPFPYFGGYDPKHYIPVRYNKIVDKNQPSYYANKIVQWEGDHNKQPASWLVMPDLTRQWVPDIPTYFCLRGLGVEDAGPISADLLKQLPDQTGHSVLCGSMQPVSAKLTPTPTMPAAIPTPTTRPVAAPTTTPPPVSPPSPTATTPPPPPPQAWTEQEGDYGANSFSNPHNASGMGPHLAAMAYVQVSCKLYDPYIASVNPDGYWYRIASAPWNNQYYVAANTFWNGDIPGVKPYTHNTDWNVRNC